MSPWLVNALQCLAYWVGYSRSRFFSYPLSEAAIVAEACALMQAKLPHELILVPERMYRTIMPNFSSSEHLTERSRADIVVCDKSARSKGKSKDISKDVRFVIEVKRTSASDSEMFEDLRRLGGFLKAANNDARAFLIVVSERKADRRFVQDGGVAVLGKRKVPGCGSSSRYCVRRVLKATQSFKAKGTAHYVCLIEVLL